MAISACSNQSVALPGWTAVALVYAVLVITSLDLAKQASD